MSVRSSRVGSTAIVGPRGLPRGQRAGVVAPAGRVYCIGPREGDEMGQLKVAVVGVRGIGRGHVQSVSRH